MEVDMKPNPGGILKGEAIIDREKEIYSIWRALQNQSVVITSERRVGKTCILRKMEENPGDDWIPVLYWVEGKEHPIEFVEGLYETILEKKLIKNKFYNLKRIYKKYVGGDHIGSWKLPQIKENWKTILESIGIHLVIKDLKENHGYNSDPINNMKIISISSMEEKGALELCEKLGEDEYFELDDRKTLFDHICRKTDRLPFYIHHVFNYFYETSEKRITRQAIDNAIDYLLNDPKDEGFFRHYLDRIKTYYEEKSQKIALIILDRLCKEKNDVEEMEIIHRVRNQMDIDDESIKEALDLTWSDHYLTRKIKDNHRFYAFRYEILKRWWLINRG
jgi:hypothetical protein